MSSDSDKSINEQQLITQMLNELRSKGPLNVRHAKNPVFHQVLNLIFRRLIKDHVPSGGFYRNSPAIDAYNFRLVCREFCDASSPHFEKKFFHTRQGTTGAQSLQPLLNIAHTRFGQYVKVLVLNLFPTAWRPEELIDSPLDKQKRERGVATYWDESRYFTWIHDVASGDSFVRLRDTLIQIFNKLPNLGSICVNAYTFNEFFCCSRRNYLAMVAHRAGNHKHPLSNYRVSHNLLAKDHIGYHQLLGTWSKCLDACYQAFQYSHTLHLYNLKLRLPEEMFRFGNPPFPRDTYRRTLAIAGHKKAWYEGIQQVGVSIIMSEPSIPRQIGSLEQTSDRWVSRFLYGMNNLKLLSMRSTNSEVIRSDYQNGHFDRALIFYRQPTLQSTGIEPDRNKILPFCDTPPWTWPTLPHLTRLTICNIQVSYNGLCAFLELNKHTLKQLCFDGHNHVYSKIENEGWYDFILHAGITCESLSVQFTEHAMLLSWMWIKDKWRSTETYTSSNDNDTISPEKWRNWSECWKHINKSLVPRDSLLADYDYHEKLPRQFNPFHFTPHYEK